MTAPSTFSGAVLAPRGLSHDSGPDLSRLPIAANSATVGQVQSRVCGVADAEGALDGFWPPRTMTERKPIVCTGEIEPVIAARPGGPALSLFAPADRRVDRRSGSASGSCGEAAASAARAARRAALKT
jgi:hypothetical protein